MLTETQQSNKDWVTIISYDLVKEGETYFKN